MKWEVGQILLGQYGIKQVFESGGMGIVYKVRHLGWGIDLALKHPRANFTHAPSQVTAFEQEIETWAELGLHPNVATCHYSRQINGVPCVFAEFVDGGSLRDWITSRRLYRGGEEAAVSRIFSIAVQFAWGLAWAHQHGLVHQDVKTGNVLMTMDGTAKVTDFGLAGTIAQSSAAQLGLGSSTVTFAGWTPAYGSPEQAQGLRVTLATDIWSWAVCVMEMFMGDICWQSGPVASEALKAYDQQGRRTRGMPEMPQEVVTLLLHCLERDPARRLNSFSQIADLLMHLHTKIFGEPCDVVEPDTEFLAADALNNRGVSLMDTGRIKEATQRFQKCISVDESHPEANCNLVVAQFHAHSLSPLKAKQILERFNQEWHNQPDALRSVTSAMLWLNKAASGDATHPVCSLAIPRTGAEHAADAARFKRLLTKAEAAMSESRYSDAQRYIQMAIELPGYERHPRAKNFIEKM